MAYKEEHQIGAIIESVAPNYAGYRSATITSTYTAPETGYMYIEATLKPTSSQSAYFGVQINGLTFLHFDKSANTGQELISQIIPLKKGDRVFLGSVRNTTHLAYFIPQVITYKS